MMLSKIIPWNRTSRSEFRTPNLRPEFLSASMGDIRTCLPPREATLSLTFIVGASCSLFLLFFYDMKEDTMHITIRI